MQGDDQEENAIRLLRGENNRLKQLVFELGERIRTNSQKDTETHKKSDSSVLKLIEHKDFQLEQYAARLEEKKEQLEAAVQELEKRNAQLSLWMATLRLYQEAFENDPSAMIGVNPAGKVILYNRTAPQILGEKFKSALHQPIESVDFTSFDPSTPQKVRQSLESRKPADSSVVVRDRKILTSIYPMGSSTELHGALVKISILPK